MTREGIKKDFYLGESPKVTARGEGLYTAPPSTGGVGEGDKCERNFVTNL